jgi:hypothetical protein
LPNNVSKSVNGLSYQIERGTSPLFSDPPQQKPAWDERPQTNQGIPSIFEADGSTQAKQAKDSQLRTGCVLLGPMRQKWILGWEIRNRVYNMTVLDCGLPLQEPVLED